MATGCDTDRVFHTLVRAIDRPWGPPFPPICAVSPCTATKFASSPAWTQPPPESAGRDPRDTGILPRIARSP